MKRPRSRKRKARKEHKLGANLLSSTTTSLNTSLSEPEDGISNHFLYNETDDAIQQILKLPDISVNAIGEKKSGSHSDLSLPPISPEKNVGDYKKGTECNERTTKLPCISLEHQSNVNPEHLCTTEWLDRHEVTNISWKKALDILENKTKDTKGTHREKNGRKMARL